MVRESCGDCAKRLPQKKKMQTKRVGFTLDLRGTSDCALAVLEPRPTALVGRWVDHASARGTLERVILALPACTVVWGRGSAPSKRGIAPLPHVLVRARHATILFQPL